MLDGAGHRFGDSIASLIGWWTDAGVDVAVSERPRDWLAPAEPVRAATAAPAPVEAPGDLASFAAHLATGAYLPDAPPPRRRMAAEGRAGARLMAVIDMPEAADLAAGRLLSAEAALLDAMLAAMGLARDDLYLAPLSPARIMGGQLGPAAPALAALMRRQVALVAPRVVLALGEGASRTLLGVPRAAAAGGLRPLDHDGGTVAATALVHPRELRANSGLKAGAWATMRRVIGELARD